MKARAGRVVEPRSFTEAVTVTCPSCGATVRRTPGERNDTRSVGAWCDGRFGERHPVVLMVGPEGEAFA